MLKQDVPLGTTRKMMAQGNDSPLNSQKLLTITIIHCKVHRVAKEINSIEQSNTSIKSVIQLSTTMKSVSLEGSRNPGRKRPPLELNRNGMLSYECFTLSVCFGFLQGRHKPDPNTFIKKPSVLV